MHPRADAQVCVPVSLASHVLTAVAPCSFVHRADDSYPAVLSLPLPAPLVCQRLSLWSVPAVLVGK